MNIDRKRPRALLLTVVLATAAGAPALRGGAGEPGLVQLPGTAGCTSDSGSGGECVAGHELVSAAAAVVSPDGSHVYVAAFDSDAVVTFDRNPQTGALTHSPHAGGCISEAGSATCSDGVGLDGAQGVAVTPDGRNVYVASGISNAVAIFDRDPATGALSQKGGTDACVAQVGGACGDGNALAGAIDVAVSPDGRSVYVASFASDAIAIFDRDAATGNLTQKMGAAGCIQNTGAAGCTDGLALDGPMAVAVSPDGRHVYNTTRGDDSIAAFDRDIATGALTQKAGAAACISDSGSAGLCVNGVALDNAAAVAVSPDGGNVYVAAAASSAVALFDRDASTGALTQKVAPAGCISEDGTAGNCVDGTGLDDATGVAVSSDGRSVYAAAAGSSSVVVFDRDVSTGGLTQKVGKSGCIAESASVCTAGRGLNLAVDVAMAPDGRHVYTISIGSGAVAAFDRRPTSYDVDGDGEVDALTDTLLLLRHAFGFTGAALIGGAVDLDNCTRCTAAEIEAFIASLSESG